MSGAAGVPSYVLDTSVVLKWFREAGEAQVAEARQLRGAYLRGDCLLRAPDFLFLEVANALTAGHRSSSDKVKDALTNLDDIDLQIEPLRRSTLLRAVDLAVSLGVTVYDSYFLALAEQTGSQLLTADEKFLRRARPNPHLLALRDLRRTGILNSL